MSPFNDNENNQTWVVEGALDHSLSERVGNACAAFQRRFDAAATHPTKPNRDALREAGERLMRATARVIIELGRL